MSQRIARTKLVLEQCDQHLTSTGSLGTPIEAFLTQHLLVVLSADIQMEIYGILEKRAAKYTDKQLENYVVAAGKRVLRSIGKEDISGFVALFGQDAKEKFKNALDDATVTKYNSYISNRHNVAHERGVQMTIKEFKLELPAVDKVLAAIEVAIA